MLLIVPDFLWKLDDNLLLFLSNFLSANHKSVEPSDEPYCGRLGRILFSDVYVFLPLDFPGWFYSEWEDQSIGCDTVQQFWELS